MLPETRAYEHMSTADGSDLRLLCLRRGIEVHVIVACKLVILILSPA